MLPICAEIITETAAAAVKSTNVNQSEAVGVSAPTSQLSASEASSAIPVSSAYRAGCLIGTASARHGPGEGNSSLSRSRSIPSEDRHSG